jgi:hypothetical protein
MKYGNQRIRCLRHLIVSLGRGLFAYEIGNVVRSRSGLDLNKLMQEYEPRFLAMKGSEQTMLLNTLHKVGLGFGNEKLSI